MIKTDPQTRPVAMSVVANVGHETEQLVTNCLPEGGQGWLDFFGIPELTEETSALAADNFSYAMPANLDTVFDIHASWGVAWFDALGVLHTAGSNLIYAERAKHNLVLHTTVLPNGLVRITDRALPDDPHSRHDVTLFIAETPEDDQATDDAPSGLIERHGMPLAELIPALKLCGIDLTDPTWAYGVRTLEDVDVVIGYDLDRAIDVLSTLRNWCAH